MSSYAASGEHNAAACVVPGHESHVICNDSMRLIRHYSWLYLDWRWRLARESVQPRCPDMWRNDRWLVRARGYVVALAHCQTHKRRRAIVEQFADVHTADQIHQTDGWQRTFLEARVLSGLDSAEIAQRMRLAEEVVIAYERV